MAGTKKITTQVASIRHKDKRAGIPTDSIACIDDGHGSDDLLNLLVEVTGKKKKDKAAKTSTARTLWVPAINNHGGFGRWAFVEIADPWDAQNVIRASCHIRESVA